jgi:hypothetical protein
LLSCPHLHKATTELQWAICKVSQCILPLSAIRGGDGDAAGLALALQPVQVRVVGGQHLKEQLQALLQAAAAAGIGTTAVFLGSRLQFSSCACHSALQRLHVIQVALDCHCWTIQNHGMVRLVCAALHSLLQEAR